MKISKEQLKSIVKECLLEILSEGLGPNLNNKSLNNSRMQVESNNSNNIQVNRKTTRFDPRLDTPVSSYRDVIKKESGGNPILESIFADTAKNTLPNQLAHGDREISAKSSSKIAQQEQFVGTPEQVFGEENASRWANLAFMDNLSSKK